MPFEQRTHTYFVCSVCGHDYLIEGNPEYNKIYSCLKGGCGNQEVFSGLGQDASNYNVSTKETGTKDETWLKKTFKRPIVQGISSGLIVVIILGLLTILITHNLLSDMEKEILEVRAEISLIKGEDNAP